MTLVSELHETYPCDCPYVRAVREEYAGWNWTLSHGYIRYGKGARSVVLEHRAVAELIHGVDVSGLHVHHIDNNPLNNDAFNLVCLTNDQHRLLHAKAGGDLLTWCGHCGAEIYRSRSKFDRSRAHYCSPSCARAATCQRPPRIVLASAIYSLQNFSALGRHFGVSDNAVRKWAKYYQIDISKVDGRLPSNAHLLQLADGTGADD